MKMKSVGKVIATRVLVYTDATSNTQDVRVLLGEPRAYPDATGYFCPYQITGAIETPVMRAGGVDAYQSLQLAMKMIHSELMARTKEMEGQLVWEHGKAPGDFGFLD